MAGPGLPPLQFALVDGNPQSPQWRPPEAPQHTTAALLPWLCWSGTMGSELFEPDPRNWMRAGHEAFNAWVERTARAQSPQPTAAGGAAPAPRWAILPHHAQLLSDVSGQMRLWHDFASRGVGTVLHPAALIAPAMVRDIDDHLTRAITMLAPRCCLCVLQDIVVRASGDVALVPWGEGSLPRLHIEQLLARHLPPSVPLCVGDSPREG